MPHIGRRKITEVRWFNRKKTPGRSLSDRIRNDALDRRRHLLRLILLLSAPAIMAQLSAILMEYIDAAMVGSLGAEASASIGLVATSTWLFFGLCSAVSMGFTVQVAHLLGAGETEKARSVLRQAILAVVIFSSVLAAAGAAISGSLPRWLGGSPGVCQGASLYFLIFSASIPVLQLNFMAGGMLRSTGNMKVPGMLALLMCVLDVVFNFFLIFPSREVAVAGIGLWLPGAGLGVAGAATGTACAEIVVTVLLFRHLWCRSPELSLKGRPGSCRLRRETLRRAWKIAMPMGVERFINSAAQITLTVIVAPLGDFAIAANAFAITAESLCYMPGYGIAEAATTLVGQSIGAGRKELARRFAGITIGFGMAVMSVMGVVMYVAAPVIIGLMTPVPEILDLGVMALRIEAWAEPMFAASIVAYGAFVGAGDTVMPCVINLSSMWVIRITLAAILAPVMGLKGVWIAMCVELCCRGIMFLWRLRSGKWMLRAATLRINE